MRNIKNIGSIFLYYFEDMEEFQKNIAKESENGNSEQ